MREDIDKKPCSNGGEMLSYLYNEMPSSDRDVFELHLADCGTCIDDFAELSQTRYPVFEWKTIEFDAMPTPRVVIPYAEAAAISWAASLKAVFSFNPGMAAGSIAVLAVAALVGYLFISIGPETVEVANSVAPVSTPESVAAVIPPATPSVDEVKADRSESEPSRDSLRNDPEVQPIQRIVPVRKPGMARTIPARVEKAARRERRANMNLPTLSRIEEEDDSLRLADIFDEIGSSE